MKNKKAIGSGTLISIIIAVICIILIVGFIFKLKQSPNIPETEIKSAHIITDKIVAVYNELENKETSEQLIRGIKSDNKYFLVGWNSSDSSRPEKCFFNSCLCACPSLNFPTKEMLSNQCQKEGICKEINATEISIINPFFYESRTPLGELPRPSDPSKTTREYYPYIPLPPKFISLKIEKISNNLIIKYFSETYLKKRKVLTDYEDIIPKEFNIP